MARRVGVRDGAAKRVPQQAQALQPERIDHRLQVLQEDLRPVEIGPGRFAMTPLIDRQHAKVFAQ
jgi:hypothetical protein